VKRLRTLIVDDSPLRRQLLSDMVESTRLAVVVGCAGDGAEALKLVSQLRPDLITLDLDMPRVDGFAFLRMLMSNCPTPVIVVSSMSQRDNVFRALELGALDFISVPERGITDEARRALANKLLSIHAVQADHIALVPAPSARSRKASLPPQQERPKYLIAIAASTGGPSALTRILSKLTSVDDAAILIAQHMPANFTGAFAQRLDRYSYLNVTEASDGAPVRAGTALVCPGNLCMEVSATERLRVRLRPPTPAERYVPSANLLLASAAAAFGAKAVGVVLTGMGDDGALGARAIADGGGQVIVESEQSSVVYGMPRAALSAVPGCVSAPLDELALAIERSCRPRSSAPS
jgi:two-component system chemotaxis response regulator CheB